MTPSPPARSTGRAPACEIHVPISATPGFLGQVHALAASVRCHGGALADARIVVTVSRDLEPFDLDAAHPWAARLGVEWRWVDAARFAESGIFATALQRFTYDFAAPFVLLLDADTLCTGPLDELLELGDGALAGLIAHVAPATGHPLEDDSLPGDERFWEQLFAGAGLPSPALGCEHTGWGFMDDDPQRRRCPPYFNLGVLAGSREAVARLGTRVFEEMALVDRQLDTSFRCQLAVTLALARTGGPWRELPLRFNFPNDERFARAYPAAAADVRILHYLRDAELRRGELLGSAGALDAFLAREDLSPVNARLQLGLRELRDELTAGSGSV